MLGTLANSAVRANLSGQIMESKLSLEAFGESDLNSEPELFLSGSGSLTLEEVFSLFDCINAPCNFGGGAFDYRAMIESETLNGIAKCYDDNCSDLRFYHNLTTSNTDEFFNSLNWRVCLIRFLLR